MKKSVIIVGLFFVFLNNQTAHSNNVESEYEIGVWHDFRNAAVSFTFDDAPGSAFTNGGNILETFGYRGTYYISGGLIGRETAVGQVPNIETIRNFYGRGHEIGNHTYDHLDCKKASFFAIIKSIRRNRKMLAGSMDGSFAFPYGSVNDRAKIAARLCTDTARGISFGINRKKVDFNSLKAARVYAHER